MKKQELTHIDPRGNAAMVDVSEKPVTRRTARAQAVVHLGRDIVARIQADELQTRKGPVFQTAILAGVMGAKKTADLIPLCHPLGLDDCQVAVEVRDDHVVISTQATLSARTGVEMEALTAATVAALTIYDMCKALSHDIVIREVRLLKKTGGKQDYRATEK